MARRKGAQKRGKKVTRKPVQASKFPADCLSSELIHMVFTYLKPTEAAAFRWAGRIVAEIGLQYLAPKVYLQLNEESYDRLLAIAEHPVVSKYVVKLDYEMGGFWLLDREEFTDMLGRTSGVITQRRESSDRPSRAASARAWRAYDRESVRNIPLFSQRQTNQLVNRAWSVYVAYSVSQKKVQEANCFPEKLWAAMKQFRNLKEISTSAAGHYKRYITQIKDLLPMCRFHCWPHRFGSSNPDVTSSVLLAAASAGLHVDRFRCKLLSWDVFMHNKMNFAAMKKILFHLKFMEINLSFREYMHDLDRNGERETEIMIDCLEKGRVMDFITSAPDLEYLGLISDDSQPLFNEVIGNFCWSSLNAVRLNGLSSGEYDLVKFCKRHAYTLRVLSLSNMEQYGGSWHVTFQRIRRTFRLGQQLHICKFGGTFWGGVYFTDMDIEHVGDNLRPGVIISDYIRATNVGDITLDEYYEAVGLNHLKYFSAQLA